MKKNLKLISITVLSLILAVSFLSGCNKTSNTSSGNNEQTVLRWVLLGPGEQQDSDKVWAEFNKKLQEKMPGVTVDFQVFSKTDFAEKWKLMAASNEPVDIAWSGWLVDYKSEARKGAYMELDELMDKNAPKLKAELNALYKEMNGAGDVFDSTKVDGKIYIIPTLQSFVSEGRALLVHKELADKYLDIQKAESIFKTSETTTKECYSVLEEYLSKLKENGEIKTGVSTATFPWFKEKGYYIGNVFAIKNIGDKDYKIYNRFEAPEYKGYVDTMADWYKKGYIRNDIISVEDPRQNDGKKDGNVIWMLPTYNKFSSNTESMANGFPTYVMNINHKDSTSPSYNAYTGTSSSIPKASKNPEKAIKLLELMNTSEGKELFNMLAFGVEDTHYKKVNQDRIETFDGAAASLATANSKYGLWSWVIGNTFNTYETQSNPEGWYDYVKGVYKGANKDNDLINNFNPDFNNVKTELAQVNTVIGEFEKPLLSGALPNYDEVYNEFIGKLKKAGIDKVIEDLQKQFDEYVGIKSSN